MIVASWLDVVQDNIGTGLQDEKHDREDGPFAGHFDRFSDASKILVEVGINVCWNEYNESTETSISSDQYVAV